MTATIAGVIIRVPIKVAADGMLLNSEGLREVSVQAGGQITRIFVRLGDQIQVGQPIARIEQPDLQQELEAARAALKDASEQLGQTVKFQERVRRVREAAQAEQRRNLETSASLTTQRRGWLQSRLDGLESLAANGQVPKQTLLQARTEVGQVTEETARIRQSLKQLDLEDSHARTQEERERLELTLKIGSTERRIVELEDRLNRLSTVVSSYDGLVAELKVNAGELVERGTALMTLVPNASEAGTGQSRHGPLIRLVATLYVPPADGKKIRPGMAVELVPAMMKREEYGFIIAKVASVAEVPSSREGMKRVLKNQQLVESLSTGGAPFEIRAELELAETTTTGFRWSSSTGPEMLLTGGSPCKADIVTRSAPLIVMLMPALRGMFAEEGWL